MVRLFSPEQKTEVIDICIQSRITQKSFPKEVAGFPGFGPSEKRM